MDPAINAVYGEAKADLDRFVELMDRRITSAKEVEPELTDAELAVTLASQLLASPDWSSIMMLASVLGVAVVEISRARTPPGRLPQ